VFVLLLVVVGLLVFVVAAVAAGSGSSMAPAHPDRPGPYLPAERTVRHTDVEQVRFSVGLRGYRMDEVDDVLDRLSAELADRDARIGELERELSSETTERGAADAASPALPPAPEAATEGPAVTEPAAEVEATRPLAEPIRPTEPVSVVKPVEAAGPVEPTDATKPTEPVERTADVPSAPAERSE
jgi:DivIVA domain-containing protein